MIVSIATAVLPVWRSPMISWRWPRPMAVIASIALMPVCSGSFTGWRCTTVGACSSSDAALLGLDLAQAVDRLAQRVDHAAEEAVADRHRQDLAGAADRLALLDAAGSPRMHDTDLAHVEVQREAEHAVLELEQLVGHRRGQALDAGDAVAGLGDGADLLAGDLRGVRRDVALERAPDLIRGDVSSAICSAPLHRSSVVGVRRLPARRGAPHGRSAGQPAPGSAAGRHAAVDDLVATRTTRPPSTLRVHRRPAAHLSRP